MKMQILRKNRINNGSTQSLARPILIAKVTTFYDKNIWHQVQYDFLDLNLVNKETKIRSP